MSAVRVTNAPAAKPAPRRFTVKEYYRMAKAGILNEDNRVELIEGEIICIPPIGPGHQGDTDHLRNVFAARLAGRALVRVQRPVRLNGFSEPQPDLLLLRPRADYYRNAHPSPGDVLLLVEVSDRSLVYDRGRKLRIYGRFGIPEVWIVNIRRREIEVYRRPGGERYEEVATLAPGQAIAPIAFPDGVLQVSDIV